MLIDVGIQKNWIINRGLTGYTATKMHDLSLHHQYLHSEKSYGARPRKLLIKISTSWINCKDSIISLKKNRSDSRISKIRHCWRYWRSASKTASLRFLWKFPRYLTRREWIQTKVKKFRVDSWLAKRKRRTVQIKPLGKMLFLHWMHTFGQKKKAVWVHTAEKF